MAVTSNLGNRPAKTCCVLERSEALVIPSQSTILLVCKMEI